MSIIEYDDAYSFVLDGYHYNSRNCQEFTIEIEEGLEATFYKKNARNSKKADIWKLGELAFYKDTSRRAGLQTFSQESVCHPHSRGPTRMASRYH